MPLDEKRYNLLITLEAAIRFELMNRSFADCSLNHLGTPPSRGRMVSNAPTLRNALLGVLLGVHA